MPIRIKTDLEFGQVFYLKTDPAQLRHQLAGVVFLPGNQLKFRLAHNGSEEVEVWDFECSSERDESMIGNEKEEE